MFSWYMASPSCISYRYMNCPTVNCTDGLLSCHAASIACTTQASSNACQPALFLNNHEAASAGADVVPSPRGLFEPKAGADAREALMASARRASSSSTADEPLGALRLSLIAVSKAACSDSSSSAAALPPPAPALPWLLKIGPWDVSRLFFCAANKRARSVLSSPRQPFASPPSPPPEARRLSFIAASNSARSTASSASL
mmetsp:Transcript_45585/g.73488  ORF Transcript_45585/g.73488 Transcript_45585/m.73488 type:complete len:200 (+) Transcript_45585:2675-3274(+)